MKKTDTLKSFTALHIILLVYSLSTVLSKLAGTYPFLSLKFCLCYGAVILFLGIYAIGWQQIIKRFPLTTAFANKAVTLFWGLVWGTLFFHEKITVGKIVGVAIVMIGVIIYAGADIGETQNDDKSGDLSKAEAENDK